MKRAYRIYVAGPMSLGNNNNLVNLRRAIDAAHQLVRAGFSPFIPQLTYVWGLVYPYSHEQWLQIDFPWLDQTDGIVRLPGESKGSDAETARGEKNGQPVFRGATDDDAVRACIRHFQLREEVSE